MPSQKELRRLFTYNRSTGLLRSRLQRGKIKVGSVCGAVVGTGYVLVGVGARNYQLAHRIIWTLLYGKIPAGFVIDHINGVPSDNRLKNLRLVSFGENRRNSKLYKSNKYGVPGLYYDNTHKRMRLSIKHDGKVVYHRNCDSIEEARRVREAVDSKYGFHKNHGRII